MGSASKLIKTTCTLSCWVLLIYRNPESRYSVPPAQFSLPYPPVFMGINKKEELVEDEEATGTDVHTLVQNSQVSRSDNPSLKRFLTPKTNQCRDVQSDFILQLFFYSKGLLGVTNSIIGCKSGSKEAIHLKFPRTIRAPHI